MMSFDIQNYVILSFIEQRQYTFYSKKKINIHFINQYKYFF